MDIDKELDSNWEWALDKVLKHRDIVEEKYNNKEKVSSKEDFKATKRMGNELVYNPWAYAEYLEDARSNDKTGARITRDLLNFEGKHLGSGPESQKLFLGDTVHHWLAQRTGGSTVTNLSHPERHNFHDHLAGSKYTLGNRLIDGQRNLYSFMRSFHLNSDALKLQEYNALSPLGATQAKHLNTPKAHSTTGNAVTGTHNVTSGADAFTLMEPQMALQDKDSQAAYDVMRPIQQKIQALVGLPDVNQGSSGLEKKALRQAVADNSVEVEAFLRKEMGPNVLQFTREEVMKKTISPIMKSYQPTALGGFVHGERGPTKTAPQTPYTPPKQEGYVHRNKGPQETPPVGGEELTIPGFLTPDNVIKTGQAAVGLAGALLVNSMRAATFAAGSYLLK